MIVNGWLHLTRQKQKQIQKLNILLLSTYLANKNLSQFILYGIYRIVFFNMDEKKFLLYNFVMVLVAETMKIENKTKKRNEINCAIMSD